MLGQHLPWVAIDIHSLWWVAFIRPGHYHPCDTSLVVYPAPASLVVSAIYHGVPLGGYSEWALVSQCHPIQHCHVQLTQALLMWAPGSGWCGGGTMAFLMPTSLRSLVEATNSPQPTSTGYTLTFNLHPPTQLSISQSFPFKKEKEILFSHSTILVSLW